ncbi:ankyrin repeat domain-containing protein 54-like isoform X1 [Liolophura sinensis]|uniref:ankyrin repeat domain-containing protein 54-like isoform X1 n=1 Tax=Liolophura sinensis TaxID=3198878 RepID=UPI0031594DBB
MTSSQTESANDVSDSDDEFQEATEDARSTNGRRDEIDRTSGPSVCYGMEQPSFDFSDWNPEAPAGLQFLCLIPQLSGYEAKYEQGDLTGKVKISLRHRQQRLRHFKQGKTVGRDIADEKRLRQAANKNDYSLVLELLESGVDPSSCDDKKRTPLHFAAAQGNELIVKLLLDHGADPNLTDILGNTPLHLAACTIASHIAVVTLLLKAGTNLRAVDKSGRTPLSFAKSRLRVVMQQTSSTSEQLKKDIHQVIEMMKEYLSLSGMTEDALQLDSLCEQLSRSTTIEQVYELNTLLSDFTNMTLHKKSQPSS